MSETTNSKTNKDDSVEIFDYMDLTKKERTSHISLSSECIPSVLTRNSSRGKKGDFTSPERASIEASKNLSELLNVSGKEYAGRYVNTCHACCNDSSAPLGFVCVNPNHLYFGTPKENCEDKSYWNKRKGGLASWNLTEEEKEERKRKLSRALRDFYKTPKGKKVKEKQSSVSTQNMLNQLATGNHISQKVHECEHCGKTSKGRIFFRWHGQNCRHNPANQPKKTLGEVNED